MSAARAFELLAAGKPAEAESLLRRMLQKSPGDIGLNNAMTEVLIAQARYEQAVFFSRRCADLSPREAGVLANHAQVLCHAGRFAEALAFADRAVAMAPKFGGAHNARGMACAGAGNAGEALASFSRAGELEPDSPHPVRNTAKVLADGGRIDDAIAALRDGLKRLPGSTLLHSTLVGLTNYTRSLSALERLEAHRAAASVYEAQGSGAVPPDRPREPDRPLTVGFLSSDLRAHSVAYFVEPLLEHMPEDVKTIGYANSSAADAVSKRLKSLCGAWREVATLDDAHLDAQIRADGVDVLVELNGWTYGSRFGAIVRRPAPVIATFLGYPNTTALSAVGWRLVDSRTDPPGVADGLVTERLARMDPCFLCYRPPAGAPEVEERSPGPVTFGSFNAIWKMNPGVTRTWARLLARVPGSRLVLKVSNGDSSPLRNWLPGVLASEGVAPERVEYLPNEPRLEDHLRTYRRLDVALDPLPYCGTTTTCEAFLMGVPVVSCAGDFHAGRVGASLLAAMDLDELIARDEAEYVEIAAALAADPDRLAELRRSMRARLLASPLRDEAGYAGRFRDALRAAWREWCALGA